MREWVTDSITVGGRQVYAYDDVPYNIVHFWTVGPRLRKAPYTVLRCIVSMDLINDMSSEIEAIIMRQFDDAADQVFRHYATIGERKMRRYARRIGAFN